MILNSLAMHRLLRHLYLSLPESVVYSTDPDPDPPKRWPPRLETPGPTLADVERSDP
jgi:hypothetical protein